jgi:hypothetical protein
MKVSHRRRETVEKWERDRQGLLLDPASRLIIVPFLILSFALLLGARDLGAWGQIIRESD